MIKIGLLSFSDGRERVHRNLEPGITKNARLLQEKLEETGEIKVEAAPEIIWRHALARDQAKAVAPAGTIIPNLGSNHVHGVAGDFQAELTKFCALTGIEVEVI